jgi:hypothetical protein
MIPMIEIVRDQPPEEIIKGESINFKSYVKLKAVDHHIQKGGFEQGIEKAACIGQIYGLLDYLRYAPIEVVSNISILGKVVTLSGRAIVFDRAGELVLIMAWSKIILVLETLRMMPGFEINISFDFRQKITFLTHRPSA